MFSLQAHCVTTTSRAALFLTLCVLCAGHAGAVGPTPPNVQHQQVGAEAESPGRPGHPQVLRLHQREAEIHQFFRLGSVFTRSAKFLRALC